MIKKVVLLFCMIVIIFILPVSATVFYAGISWDTVDSDSGGSIGITMNDTYFWIVSHKLFANDRVYQYYINGTYTGTSWDTAGSGNDDLTGIIMNTSYFWIVDKGTDEVYQYHINGTYTGTSWDTAGSGNNDPFAITMNTSYFWITDAFDDSVYQYHINGTYTGTSWDTAGSGCTEPRGITMDDAYFWIASLTEDEVYQYHINGTYTGTSWDTAGSGNNNPRGITMDDTYFWVVDYYDKVYQYIYNTMPTDQTNLGNNLIDHTPTITWTKGASAEADTITTYIYVGTTSTPTAIEGFTTEETYDLGTNITLTDGGTYYYRLRSYNGTSYSNYTTADEFRMNSITVPTVLTPLYDDTLLSNNVSINVSSVDLENDSLSYYIYGDTIDGTTLINVSSSGAYTWNVGNYDTYYWKAQTYDGYEYSTNTSLQRFTVLVPPNLQTPTNASTHTYSFPPLLHDLTFTWQDTNAPAYKYQVATDDDFNLIAEEDTITSNTTTLSLEADDYYWRVYAYETSTGTYSNASDVWAFTINETNGNGAVTAIDGVVYEITTAGSIAVDGALVNIWNTTWSDSMLVGQNGYYYFDGAKDGTYSVRATKTGYTDSSIELVTVQALNTTTRNILLQSYTGAGREYVTHYVLFTVKTLWGTLYSGVDVNVYLGDAVIALYTGTTGTDGSVGFELVESNEYRLTFIDASQGINEEITIYPVKSEYPVYIYDTLAPDDEDIESEEVTVSVTTSEINDTHAYINITYTDGMNETTDLNIYINQSDESDPFNQTVITYANLGATSSITHSFIIGDYPGQAYFINVGATHTTFGDIRRTYSVRFDGMLEDHGFSKIWVWIGVGGMMFVAGMFKASKAEQGALVVCVVGWVFMGFGFFDSLGSQAVTSMKAGLGLATVLAVGANMSKKHRDETT